MYKSFRAAVNAKPLSIANKRSDTRSTAGNKLNVDKTDQKLIFSLLKSELLTENAK